MNTSEKRCSNVMEKNHSKKVESESNSRREPIGKQNNEYEASSSRRRLLKAGSTVAALGAIPSIIGAKKGPDEVYKKALKLREKTGDHELFVKYLENHGFNVSVEERDFKVPTGSSDGISTQKIDKADVSTKLYLSGYDCSVGEEHRIEFHFSVSTSLFNDGKAGPDHLSLAWNGDHYRIVDYSWYTSSQSPNLNYSESELNGIDFEWQDGNACWSGCDLDLYVGCKVETLKTDQDRAVRGEYRHTWSGAEFSGFGVSSGGSIVFSVSPTSNYWEGGYDTDEPYCN